MNTKTLNPNQLEQFRVALAQQTDATLAMKFKGSGVSVIYQGIVKAVSSPRDSIGKLEFLPFDEMRQSGPSDAPPVSLELSPDDAGGVAFEFKPAQAIMNWEGTSVAVRLEVSVDPG